MCVCVHVFITSTEETFLFLYVVVFFLMIYFGFFPLGGVSVKLSNSEIVDFI